MKSIIKKWIKLKSYLTLVILSLSVGCSQLKPFPEISKFAIDYPNQLCGEFKLIDPENQTYQYVGSYPLSYCDGYFAMSPDDEIKVKNWILDAKIFVEQNCKR
jgi:hypothetical protein